MKKQVKYILIALSFTVVWGADSKPNIVLIMSDDVGYETIGTYGGVSWETPVIDKMAEEGIRFDYAHSNCICTPSRVKIMTGKYNLRNYEHFAYLSPEDTTFGHVMQSAGYKTLVAGKWQLYEHATSYPGEFGMHPSDAGFDEHCLWQVTFGDRGSRFWDPSITTNSELKAYPGEFGPDILNDYVLDFIQRNQDTAFFVYYPMVLAHNPWVTTPDRLNAGTKNEKFAAMMNYMDKMVGNVISKLEELGLREETLVMFLGDNGTNVAITSDFRLEDGSIIQVQGGKALMTDAGSHVPFVADWPGVITPGSVSNSLIGFADFFPTIADAADISLPDHIVTDGQSFYHELVGTQGVRNDWLYIYYHLILSRSRRPLHLH